MKTGLQWRVTPTSETVLTTVAAYAGADRMGQQMTTAAVANRLMADRFAFSGRSICGVILMVTTRGYPDRAATDRNL